MFVIKQLTKEQEEQIPIYKKKWFEIGSSCEPADRKTAEEAISEMYNLVGWPTPRFIWVDSPATGSIIRRNVQHMDVAERHRPERTGLGNNLAFEMREILGDRVDDGGAYSGIEDMNRSLAKIVKNINKQVRRKVRNELSMRDWLSQINHRLFFQVDRDVKDNKELFIGLCSPEWSKVNGQLYADTFCFHKYYSEVLHFTFSDKYNMEMDLWERIIKSIGWWFPYENVCVCCERPKAINFETNRENSRLHCENGPALEFRDGYKVYCWKGVWVDSDIIEKPITLKQIEEEKNAEIRRVMLDKYGFTNYIRDSKFEPIAKDGFGELYRKEVPGLELITVVHVKNSTPELDGTVKEYWLPVQPDLRPMLENGNFGEPQELTPKNAIASTFGLRGEQYNPLKET